MRFGEDKMALQMTMLPDARHLHSRQAAAQAASSKIPISDILFGEGKMVLLPTILRQGFGILEFAPRTGKPHGDGTRGTPLEVVCGALPKDRGERQRHSRRLPGGAGIGKRDGIDHRRPGFCSFSGTQVETSSGWCIGIGIPGENQVAFEVRPSDGFLATGIRMKKVVPLPSTVSKLSSPPCLSTITDRAIANPCPVPLPTSLVVKKGS